MAEISLGVIYPAGKGPTRATSNQLSPTAALWAHSYRVQHWKGNSPDGRGFVGGAAMDDVGNSAYGVVPAKSEAPPWPVYNSPTSNSRDNPHNMACVYIDSENATDGFLVTIMQV